MESIRVHSFGDPSVLKLEEVGELRPAPHELVVSVRAAGVNPVEAYIRSGQHRALPKLPYTPGSDGAGLVEAIGSRVSRFAVGDRVYLYGAESGTYAERALCEETEAHPLPKQLSYEQGAAIGVPYGTAWRALFHRARVKQGQTVLIHGASGGVGIAAVQLALAAQVRVIATTSTEEGCDALKALGAQHVLTHSEANDPARIDEITAGRGVHAIIEMLANANLGHDLKVIAPHGHLVIVGSRGPVEIDPRDAMMKEVDIHGMTLRAATEDEISSMHEALGEGFAEGQLRPLVSLALPLAEAAKAHEAILKGGHVGKIVLIP